MTRTLSDMTVAGTLIVVALVTAIVGFLSGKAIHGAPAYPAEQLNITILLTDDTPGVCKATSPPGLKSKRLHEVSWSIANNCSNAQYVRIDHFRRQRDDGSFGFSEGILEYVPETDTPIDARSGGALGPVRVIKQPDKEAFYKYEVLVSTDKKTWTSAVDPDIDIWP
jgi:hypothetical protein